MNYRLLKAIEKGNLELVKELLEQGAEINARDKYGWTALHFASLYGHLEIVKELHEAGAEIEAKTNNNGMTALHYASRNGHLEIVKYLVEKGADIEAKTNYNKTSLHLAFL